VQLESRGRRAAEEANKGLQVEADNARQAVRDLQVKVDKAESEVYTLLHTILHTILHYVIILCYTHLLHYVILLYYTHAITLCDTIIL
jgi:hypothetical protein